MTMQLGFPASDSIVLGGERIPGVWHLLPGLKEFGWQEQKGMGLSGATLRITGDPLVKCEFVVQFFRESDWVDFQSYRAKYFRKPAVSQGTKSTYSLAIQHPELHAVGVNAVVFGKVPWFTNTGKGLWVGQVHFIEYRLAQPALESPRAKIPSVTTKPPVAQTALEQENVGLAAELKAARDAP
jgi:hypothetical protein